MESDFLKYKGRVKVNFNGLTLSLMKKDVKQLTEEHLKAIRKYDKKKMIRNSIATRRNQVMFLLFFARTVKKPLNKVTKNDSTDFQSRKKLNGKEIKPSAVNWNTQILKP